jgi:hypothetical protein
MDAGPSVKGTGPNVKDAGPSVKSTGFSVKGTGFSPYINRPKINVGFSPRGNTSADI